MAQFGAPPKSDFPVLTPRPQGYEFVCTDVQEVPNDSGQYKYDPTKDDPRKATKLKWFFTGRKGTDAEGVVVSAKTGSYLTRDKRNKMLQFCEAIDPTFDIDVAYKDEADFRAKVVNKPVLLSIVNNEGTTSSGEKAVFNNVEKAWASAMPQLDTAELMALLGSVTVHDGDNVPL